MRQLGTESIDHGLRVPAVKWLMFEALATGGIGIYGFYALQPYLLELYGDPHAYVIAGLSAAIVAGAQILGGWRRRRSAAASGGARRRCSSPPLGAQITLGRRSAASTASGSVVAFTVVWALLFAHDADPPGLHERDDPVQAARDDPLVRFA